MSDKYKQDGEDICCAECGISAEEFFTYVADDTPPDGSWFTGSTWYCCDECYEDHTKDEG